LALVEDPLTILQIDSLIQCWIFINIKLNGQGFKNKSKGNLENVIGAIDGSHIPIEKPDGKYAFRYINRKGYYSVILLGIVDHQGKFTYIYIGEPGSVHDACVLRKSRLWNHVGKFSFNK